MAANIATNICNTGAQRAKNVATLLYNFGKAPLLASKHSITMLASVNTPPNCYTSIVLHLYDAPASHTFRRSIHCRNVCWCTRDPRKTGQISRTHRQNKATGTQFVFKLWSWTFTSIVREIDALILNPGLTWLMFKYAGVHFPIKWGRRWDRRDPSWSRTAIDTQLTICFNE